MGVGEECAKDQVAETLRVPLAVDSQDDRVRTIGWGSVVGQVRLHASAARAEKAGFVRSSGRGEVGVMLAMQIKSLNPHFGLTRTLV